MLRPMVTAAALELATSCRPFTIDDARRHGVSRFTVQQLHRAGVIRQILHGVYVEARLADDVVLRAQAIACVLPDGAAICRRTAAWLMGVDARAPGEHTQPPPLECVVPVGMEPVSRPGIACYVADLPPDDVVVIGRLPTTAPTRTAVDLLRWAPPFVGLAAADALAADGLVDRPAVMESVERWRGARGTAKARYLAALIEPRTESAGESWLRLRIVDAGLPRPQVQIEVCDERGRVVWRLDLGWREKRKAVEYDGTQFHDAAHQRAHDARRRAALERDYGWRVLGVNKGDVLGRSMMLEYAVGEMLGIEPKTRRRLW